MKNRVVNISLLMVALLGTVGCGSLVLSSGGELALVGQSDAPMEVKLPTANEAQGLASDIIERMGLISAAALEKVKQFRDAFISPMIAKFNDAYASMKEKFDAASKAAKENFSAATEKFELVKQQLATKLRELKGQLDEYKEPVAAVASSMSEMYYSAQAASSAKAELDQTVKIFKRSASLQLSPVEKKIFLDRLVDLTGKIKQFIQEVDEKVLANLVPLFEGSDVENVSTQESVMNGIRNALKSYQDTYEIIKYLVSEQEELNIYKIKEIREPKVKEIREPAQEIIEEEEEMEGPELKTEGLVPPSRVDLGETETEGISFAQAPQASHSALAAPTGKSDLESIRRQIAAMRAQLSGN